MSFPLVLLPLSFCAALFDRNPNVVVENDKEIEQIGASGAFNL
jgi:hypothetical protein